MILQRRSKFLINGVLYMTYLAALLYSFLLFIWCKSPQWARASSFPRFLDHTQTHHIRLDSLDEG